MPFFFAVLAILYPLIAYVGLTLGSPSIVACCLIVILLLRFKFASSMFFDKQHIRLFILSVIAVLGYSLVTDSSSGIRFYPVVISMLFLLIFAQSLWSKQSVIERLARLTEPDLPPTAVAYTRKVTIVWCVFFAVNGSIAFYTTLFSSMETWTLYNGLVSYCIMGIIGGLEWLVRKKFKYKQQLP